MSFQFEVRVLSNACGASLIPLSQVKHHHATISLVKQVGIHPMYSSDLIHLAWHPIDGDATHTTELLCANLSRTKEVTLCLEDIMPMEYESKLEAICLDALSWSEACQDPFFFDFSNEESKVHGKPSVCLQPLTIARIRL